jgi:hypothetical protein
VIHELTRGQNHPFTACAPLTPYQLELFAAEVDEAVFKSGVLDETCSPCRLPCTHQFTTRFHLPYIQRLALEFPLDCAPDWVRAIHEVANRLEAVTDNSLFPKCRPDYIKELCQLASGYLTTCLPQLRANLFPLPCHNLGASIDGIETDAFAAAVYLDLLSVVSDMVDSVIGRASCREETVSPLFGDPIRIAVKHNKRKAIELLLDKAFANEKLRYRGFTLMKEGALVHAARVGNLETVVLLLSGRWGSIVVDRRTLDTNYKSRTREAHCLDSALETPAPAIFNKVFEYRQSTCLKGPIPVPMLHRIAMIHVDKDNKDMLRWLLESHFRESRDGFFREAIDWACVKHHTEMVQLLLGYAPPHEKKIPGAISLAASGGRMELVKLLLDQGNDINEEYRRVARLSHPPAIVSAIALEHTQMFYFLRERGATFKSAGTIEKAVGIAKATRLDSMLELLVTEGVDIDRWPPCSEPLPCNRCEKVLYSKKAERKIQ